MAHCFEQVLAHLPLEKYLDVTLYSSSQVVLPTMEAATLDRQELVQPSHSCGKGTVLVAHTRSVVFEGARCSYSDGVHSVSLRHTRPAFTDGGVTWYSCTKSHVRVVVVRMIVVVVDVRGGKLVRTVEWWVEELAVVRAMVRVVRVVRVIVRVVRVVVVGAAVVVVEEVDDEVEEEVVFFFEQTGCKSESLEPEECELKYICEPHTVGHRKQPDG